MSKAHPNPQAKIWGDLVRELRRFETRNRDAARRHPSDSRQSAALRARSRGIHVALRETQAAARRALVGR